MSLTQVSQPYPVFTDSNGDPLDAGYVYIGQPNQNPETNLISVFWDPALTLPIVQPIRTINGYASRNGTPSPIYANVEIGRYSITVKDRKHVTVFTSPVGNYYYVTYAEAANVSYQLGSAETLLTDVQSKLEQAVTVADFVGSDPTGMTSSLAAFQQALDDYRNVRVTAGTYVLDDLLHFNHDGTSLFLDAGVTLLCSGWIWNGTQIPFGNQLNVIADNCAIIGSGPSSQIRLTGGSQANAIGLLHKSGLLLKNFLLDGDKANAAAITDDTFESGISVIAAASAGVVEDANVLVDGVIIQNFVQYGVNIYGDKANGVRVVNSVIQDNGSLASANSVGAGIVATRAVSDLVVANNVIKNNKNKGVFISSAGATGANYTITGNTVHQNGSSGISITEELNYASVAGVGLSGISITGNICTGNAIHGIACSTFDNVGLLSQITITGNTCYGNTQYGIISQSNASPNNVRAITISGNTTTDNGSGGVAYSPNISLPNVFGNINNSVAFYAQGSWTPSVKGSTTAGVGTYTSQTGKYTKIGDVLFYDFVVTWSSHTGTGGAIITGFPIVSDSVEPQDYGQLSVLMPLSTPVVGQYVLSVQDSNTEGLILDFSDFTSGLPAEVPISALESVIRGNGWYRVAN